MKKIVLTGLALVFSFTALFAGDVATLVDGGFSADGKYYVFGQYGMTDKTYQGWAEIYQVDIEKNDYVDSGVFKTKPTAVTAGKNGKEIYEALESKNYFYLKNLDCEKANIDHVLYILDDVNKKGSDEIIITDFRGSDIEKPDTFHIQLVSNVNGSGKNAKSSFFIMVEKRDADGNVIARQKVGSPDIVRKGITNYKIERIFCDKSETNFIFIVEKILEDDKGISIRYMIEAAKMQ